MALNKNALIRYKTIDKCLQNQFRRWMLEDLVEACSEALYEYEGRVVNVSRRTTQLDIQLMRSDKLGYNAPIEVYDKKYYRYADPSYSITKVSLSGNDLAILLESVEILKQFKDFSLFQELNGIVQKLEDTLYAEQYKHAPIIHFDKNENLKGLKYLDQIYRAVLEKIVLSIEYQSFKAKKPSTFPFHPYILKQFNNRWFVLGTKDQKETINLLALDRIVTLKFDLKQPYLKREFDAQKYFQNTIGVTVLNDEQVKEIVFRIDAKTAPYVETKPFHTSQTVLERQEDGAIIFKIKVHQNFELVRMILGFGNSIEVLQPSTLRQYIQTKLQKALSQYE